MVVKQRDIHPVMIPENISLDELLTEYPVSSVPNAKDYLLYLLSIIRINVQEQGSVSQQEFTRISSTAIQKIVDNYSILFRWLAERQIIEIDDYIIKTKKKGYRFHPVYVTSLKEEFINNQLLIKKLKKEPLVNLIVSGYGYQPMWYRYKHVAQLLNLMPIKMKQGLIKHNLISSDSDNHREVISDKLFYYELVFYRGGYTGDVLFINADYVDEIRNLAMRFPSDFPEKKVKKPKEFQIS